MSEEFDMNDGSEVDPAKAHSLMKEYFELNAPSEEFDPGQQTAVNNCSFKFKCPKQWEDLQKTEFHNIRLCNMCLERVYFCRTELEVSWATQAGLCVAAVTPDKQKRRVTLGIPKGFSEN